MLSTRDKIRNVCLAKERSIKVGNVGKKIFIDLLTLSETVRMNRYWLTVQDGFTRLDQPKKCKFGLNYLCSQ